MNLHMVYSIINLKIVTRISWEKINTSLKKIISVYKNFYYYDLTKSERSIGSKFCLTKDFGIQLNLLLSHDGFNQISKDLSEMLFSIFNKRSKCLF